MKQPRKVIFILIVIVSIIINLPLLTGLSWNREVASPRKDKEDGENMLENWQSWSEPNDDCDCDCNKAKTVAIVIPKYKFVDIPMAKEIPSEKIKYTTTVQVQDGSKHETYDQIDEHNHQILDSMELKREGKKTTSKSK